MNRRGFLQGIFGGVAATGLIVSASPSEIEAFTAPLTKGAPLALDQWPVSEMPIGAGEHLYNSRGEFVAIVSRIDVSVDKIEVTSAWDSNRVYLPGRQHIDICATGVCSIEQRGPHGMPRLRGVQR